MEKFNNIFDHIRPKKKLLDNMPGAVPVVGGCLQYIQPDNKGKRRVCNRDTHGQQFLASPDPDLNFLKGAKGPRIHEAIVFLPAMKRREESSKFKVLWIQKMPNILDCPFQPCFWLALTSQLNETIFMILGFEES